MAHPKISESNDQYKAEVKMIKMLQATSFREELEVLYTNLKNGGHNQGDCSLDELNCPVMSSSHHFAKRKSHD